MAEKCGNRAEYILRGSGEAAGRLVCGRCVALIDYGNTVRAIQLSDLGPVYKERCETPRKP